MHSIVFKGDIPNNLSKEEVRSVFHATEMLLSYHNLQPSKNQITVKFTDKDLGKTKTGSHSIGSAVWKESKVWINTPWIEKEEKPYSPFVTVAIHEMIHVFRHFDRHENEKLTSTLTAKLKPDVIRLANILVENTYQRAGFIAHTKISYKPKGEDHYDDSQYHEKHDGSNGVKYRKGEK